MILKGVRSKTKFYLKINWIKTFYFNFSKFPLKTALKLPVYFYGRVNFKTIKGQITINGDIKSGMIGFGQPYEMNTIHKGIAEIAIEGTIIFNGHVQFGKDYFVLVRKNATLIMNNMSSIASNGKIICTNKIEFGEYARIGSESQVIDTNFHQMIDTVTKEKFPMSFPIKIGNYNFISNRVTILSKTITPDYCTIASNSLCTRDYTNFGSNIIIGGVPAKLLKENISRDWDGEKANMELWLKV